jgi:hypothetical protein
MIDGHHKLPVKERNLTMNMQLSTNVRRIGVPAFGMGLGLLLLAALVLAALLSRSPSLAPRHSAAPHTAQNVPISGTGSAYDGGHYGSFKLAARTVPNLSAIGTGSVYDGGHYGSFKPAARTVQNVPISGTGSAYDGGHYGSFKNP